MRAEAQAYINRIEAALSLVRLSLDWERALRRLDELNARVQDPNLWDNPKQAQAISREQKTLETAVNTVNEIAAEMADAIEFIEMGEAEGEETIVEDGLATLAALADRADADKVQALLSGEADAGILACTTGIGMCIAANRHAGIQASLVGDVETAAITRQHNVTNARMIK